MVESAQWIDDTTICAVIDGVEGFVPDDPANRHRQMVAAWEAEGNEITPLPKTKPAPG